MDVAKHLPVTRTLEWCQQHSMAATRVDGRGKYGEDAWRCFDVAVKILGPGGWLPGTLWIQCTSASNHAARRKKVMACPDVLAMLVASGDQCEVWSWSDKPEPRREVLAYPVTWEETT